MSIAKNDYIEIIHHIDTALEGLRGLRSKLVSMRRDDEAAVKPGGMGVPIPGVVTPARPDRVPPKDDSILREAVKTPPNQGVVTPALKDRKPPTGAPPITPMKPTESKPDVKVEPKK